MQLQQETILVPISPGELIDKITILEIKTERLQSPDKIRNVLVECRLLNQVRAHEVPNSQEIEALTQQLKVVNEQLWDIEESIRTYEQTRQFGDRFVELARSVYLFNDRRAKLKRQINDLCGSQLTEEKSYV